MAKQDTNTEQIILDAAEDLFLEKGFGNTKMMAIAKNAGVSHSMLHYYFRSKENLFQKVFIGKIYTISHYFEDIFDRHLPFEETIRLIMESQFNFVAQNPRLPQFILNEILSNKENRTLLYEALSPKLLDILDKLQRMLTEEIAKGAISPISLYDLMSNIVSLNLSSFIIMPILEEGKTEKEIFEMLNNKCESNVQFVLKALKP